MNIRILDYKIETKFPKWPTAKKIIVNTINPHSYCVAETDKKFKEALLSSDILIPDGIGIVYAVKFLNGIKINRITGADMHQHLLLMAEQSELKVFYLGASDDTLKKIRSRILSEFESIKVGYYSPKFKKEFSPDDNQDMVNAVNEFSPDILFVGMTAPKQEKWVYSNQHRLNVNIITSIGAVFDFYAGSVNRAPEFMINLRLEWFYRLIKEPKRLWRRYLVNNTIFIFYIIIEKFRKK